ncbi:MAG TPA: PAS domain-containing protein [Stellaceae bacterium]|nr:PAS domain-containing protein [Stellaceae bacterium]
MKFYKNLADPVHQDLYRYWNSKRQGTALPARRDIDPVEIPHLLPHILMLDVTDAPGFRYRLVGTAVVNGVGRDPTGLTFGNSLPADYAAALTTLYERVRDAGVPGFAVSEFHEEKGPERFCTRLILPLASDGKTVDKIIATSLIDQRYIRHSVLGLEDRLGTHRAHLVLDE